MLTEFLVVFLVSAATAQTGPPKFENGATDFSLEEGYKAEVWCKAIGEEPITYAWLDQTGKEIPIDQTLPVHSISAQSGSALIFDVFIRKYEGLYTCSAKNVHGKESRVFNITAFPIKNVTDETVKIQSVRIVNLTDESVTFSLTVSGKPSGYIIKYTEALEKKEETLKVGAGPKIEINGLIPSGNYTFQFMAQSTLTVKEEWYSVKEIVLLPDAPEVIFRSLGSGTLKIEWFRKWTDVMRKTIDEYNLAYRSVSMVRGNFWEYRGCFINITIPECSVSKYTIAGLPKNGYSDFYLTSHTKSGYGKSTNFKVYIE